jgi:hypothetical protein
VPIATNAPQQTASLFNHLVGECEHGRRYIEAEHLGGLEVDHELEFAGLYDRQLAGLLALEKVPGADTTARPLNVCRLNVGPVEHSLKSQGRAVDITSRGDNTHGPSNRVAGKHSLGLAVHRHTLVQDDPGVAPGCHLRSCTGHKQCHIEPGVSHQPH